MAEGYADAWYASTSATPTMTIAIGTANDFTRRSGSCPCSYQAGDLAAFGTALANTVNSFGSYVAARYSSQESVAAADDAEPAWDKEWLDTHDTLNGYNLRSSHPMYDYGSAESGYWEAEPGPKLLEAAWGFPDDFLFGEVYNNSQANQWENLILYDRSQTLYSQTMTMSGLMSTGGVPLSTQAAYDAMMAALNSHSSTAQSKITYLSYIQ